MYGRQRRGNGCTVMIVDTLVVIALMAGVWYIIRQIGSPSGPPSTQGAARIIATSTPVSVSPTPPSPIAAMPQPTWTLPPPIAANTPVPTQTPDPTLDRYYTYICPESAPIGTCATDSTVFTLAGSDVPTAWLNRPNLNLRPDRDELCGAIYRGCFVLTVSLWRGTVWQVLGSWKVDANLPNQLGWYAPSIFGAGHVIPGQYRLSIKDSGQPLRSLTLNITP